MRLLGLDRRRFLAVSGALTLPIAARAQDAYPSRPITLVVPFAAGGSTDLIARLFAERMSSDLGQPIVVENRGGAGGNIGAAAVARADPDGYTLLMATIATHALNPALYTNMPFDPVADFAPVSLLVTVPNVLVVHPSLPADDLTELIALLKAEPGKYSYASPGNGTPGHLSVELFKSMAGVDIVHIPYKGAGPALTDVIGGHVPIMVDNVPTSATHIKGGALRGIGVTTKQRALSLPDVATIAEQGLPDYETYSWNALFAPVGVPAAAVDRLSGAASAAVDDPAMRKKLADVSATPVGSTPDELRQHVEAQLALWAPIVRASGARID